jgi:hypothetical protein
LKVKSEPNLLRYWPPLLGGILVVYVLISFWGSSIRGTMDMRGFESLPVLNGGRIKSFDTVVCVSLLVIYGQQTL